MVVLRRGRRAIDKHSRAARPSAPSLRNGRVEGREGVGLVAPLRSGSDCRVRGLRLVCVAVGGARRRGQRAARKVRRPCEVRDRVVSSHRRRSRSSARRWRPVGTLSFPLGTPILYLIIRHHGHFIINQWKEVKSLLYSGFFRKQNPLFPVYITIEKGVAVLPIMW